jgi:hypothetical protein
MSLKATKTHRTGQVRALADRVAVHPRMQSAVHSAVQSALPSVIEDCLAAMFPDVEGDYIKLVLYRRKRSRNDPMGRDQRIAAALAIGEAVAAIARRESVSQRHVFRVKARAVTALTP